jgi:hypothetical protein
LRKIAQTLREAIQLLGHIQHLRYMEGFECDHVAGFGRRDQRDQIEIDFE